MNGEAGGVVIACGTADWQASDHFADVFERADAAMYANKVALKTVR